MDLRTYGIGAQILRELGVAKMKLLGSPRRMPSMTGYGLEVTGFVAAERSSTRRLDMRRADACRTLTRAGRAELDGATCASASCRRASTPR